MKKSDIGGIRHEWIGDYVHEFPIGTGSVTSDIETGAGAELVDAEEMRKNHPTTFQLPDGRELLKAGDYALISMPGERFWVEIESVTDDGLWGRIDNELLFGTLTFNHRIQFEHRNIFRFLKKSYDLQPGSDDALNPSSDEEFLKEENRRLLEREIQLEAEYALLGIYDWWNEDRTPAQIAAGRAAGENTREYRDYLMTMPPKQAAEVHVAAIGVLVRSKDFDTIRYPTEVRIEWFGEMGHYRYMIWLGPRVRIIGELQGSLTEAKTVRMQYQNYTRAWLELSLSDGVRQVLTLFASHALQWALES